MRHVEPKVHRLGFPREFCPVCAAKWMKQLWVGSCVCTGDVQLGSPLSAHIVREAPVIEVAAVIVPPAERKSPVRKSSAKKKKASDGPSLL